ncbi:ATP-binding protein [Streptomyces sp. NBC_01750]|uniref:ATP-binding protein n=1 Tax=Streptomyces sp. NBC_01750 TaxID=2975928 RepID=UPI002DDADF5A|nr:ATP-binding protein [Streptomyces sp. NBC_01750]WSD37448.1 ATP-binding protein [Streptomyces sp. NBC_01750]
MTTPAMPRSDTDVDLLPRTEHICPLPHIPEGVSVVRRRARRVLGHWALPTETADDAILVISELITNAIAHALPPAVLRLSMPVVGGRRGLRIEVTDAGPLARPRRSPDSPHPAEHEEHGRGTGIIAALSMRHGVSHHLHRITRWADLHVASSWSVP